MLPPRGRLAEVRGVPRPVMQRRQTSERTLKTVSRSCDALAPAPAAVDAIGKADVPSYDVSLIANKHASVQRPGTTRA